MCEKAFRKYRLNFSLELKSGKMEKAAEEMGFKSVDDLIASIGYGKITPLQIIRKIESKPDSEGDPASIFNKLIGRVRKKKFQAGVIVQGFDDILIKFGKCCQPVPGDPITGYITRGHGVTVHRANCVNALKMSPERQIEVDWNEEIRETYPVKIRVHSSDRIGLLADLAATISKNDANILKVNTETQDNQTIDSYFTIAVENTEHLNRVISDLKRVKLVQLVHRLR
jgi:GTP pyrophosphokinase